MILEAWSGPTSDPSVAGDGEWRPGPLQARASHSDDADADDRGRGSSDEGDVGVNVSVTLTGNARAYLARPHARFAGGEPWVTARYDRLHLLGRTLRWTMDLSRVGCGCNAALYLVAMGPPTIEGASYCDIQLADPDRCLEIDLFEGNAKAARATLHTQAGEAVDGTCNQWGCASGVGAAPKAAAPHAYGHGSRVIDTSLPFDVAASFDLGGRMRVVLEQAGRSHVLWDVLTAGNYPSPSVPEAASRVVRAALAADADGLVLVASLWAADGVDGMSWLDGGCDSMEYPHCELGRSSVSFRNLHIGRTPDPPPAPPMPPPPPPPCEYWCNVWTRQRARCAGCQNE